jgi:hypothetical protein
VGCPMRTRACRWQSYDLFDTRHRAPEVLDRWRAWRQRHEHLNLERRHDAGIPSRAKPLINQKPKPKPFPPLGTPLFSPNPNHLARSQCTDILQGQAHSFGVRRCRVLFYILLPLQHVRELSKDGWLLRVSATLVVLVAAVLRAACAEY